MKQYLVIKSVSLLAGKKTYRKDAIISANDVGEEKIARYLKGGYIRPVGAEIDDIEDADDDPSGDPPFYLITDEFLSVEELDGLKRKDLLAYAAHIGATGFKPSISEAKLRAFINEFIEKAEDADDDPSGDPENLNGTGEGNEGDGV